MRISKNEYILKDDNKSQRVFFFCMKKRTKKTDINQKRAMELCIRDKCHFLEEGEEPKCHHPISMQYINAFKGNWKKRRQEEKEDQEEENENE